MSSTDLRFSQGKFIFFAAKLLAERGERRREEEKTQMQKLTKGDFVELRGQHGESAQKGEEVTSNRREREREKRKRVRVCSIDSASL